MLLDNNDGVPTSEDSPKPKESKVTSEDSPKPEESARSVNLTFKILMVMVMVYFSCSSQHIDIRAEHVSIDNIYIT